MKKPTEQSEVGLDVLVVALPCPFCGSDAMEGGTDNARWVACSKYPFGDLVKDPCPGHACTDYYSSRGKAVAAWNTRKA